MFAALGGSILLTLLIAACAPGDPSPGPTSPAASLDAFYEQTLSLEACELPDTGTGTLVAGECGYIETPLDYDDVTGETVQVAVFRVAATGDSQGSVLVNPGGPGFPGRGFAAALALAWSDGPVRENFDIVGFDPRGTGQTVPAFDCYTDAEREDNAVSASQLSLPDTRALVDACADSVGGVDALAHFGTRDVARDMDIMRAVLGDDALTYAGVSYGTRLGAVYAEMFPENVRALVLDGAMDPHRDTLDRRIDQWTALQRAFEEVATFCIVQTDDCALGDDIRTATEEYQRLVRPLVDTPVPAGNGRELDFVEASDGVVTALYSSAVWPYVVAGFAELREGRGDTLLALRDLYHERGADGAYSDGAEATLAINCLDEDRFTPEGHVELVESALEAAPFLDPGTPVQALPDLCDGWPVEPTLGYPYATGIEGLPEVLVVSVTGDALTPHSGGISLAETLGGRLLTVEGSLHGTLTLGDTCVDAAVAGYIVDSVVPEEGARCTL